MYLINLAKENLKEMTELVKEAEKDVSENDPRWVREFNIQMNFIKLYTDWLKKKLEFSEAQNEFFICVVNDLNLRRIARNIIREVRK
jgi:hypothetical protein